MTELMVNLINLVKIKVLISAMDSLSTKDIVDIMDEFGKKQFGDQKIKYFDVMSRKLIDIIVELNRRL